MTSSVLWPCEHCVRFILAQQKSPDSDDKTISRARQGPMMRSSGRNVAQNLKVAALWVFFFPIYRFKMEACAAGEQAGMRASMYAGKYGLEHASMNRASKKNQDDTQS